MKKAILIIVGLAVVAGVSWAVFSRGDQGAEKADAATQTFTLKPGPLRVVVQATGRVVPNQEVEIKCKASGEITALPADVSDPVKKGELLIQIDPENEQRSVKRAEVALAISQAKLAQAQLDLQIAERELATNRARAEADLSVAEARAKEAQAKLDRAKQLLSQAMVSKEEYDTVETGFAQAQADLANAHTRLEELKTQELSIESRKRLVQIGQAQVEADRTSLSDAQERLTETTVVAPLDGVVGTRNVQVGQIIASAISNVGGGTSAMTLVDLSRVFVLAAVDESDIGRVLTGQPAEVTTDAFPAIRFPGQVVRVATKGVEVSSVVTFEVKIEVQGPQRELLKLAMTANVEIVTVAKEGVLTVPLAAIARRDGETLVTIARPDGPGEERVVQIGDTDGQSAEILAGLKEGEIVVVRDEGLQSRWRAAEGQAPGSSTPARRRPRMMGPPL